MAVVWRSSEPGDSAASAMAETLVAAGDRYEIVQFVGGG